MTNRLIQGVAALTVACFIIFFWRARPPADAPRMTAPPRASAPISPSSETPPSVGGTKPAPPVVAQKAPLPAKAAGTVVVKGSWGAGPGQFGRRHDPESSPEGPMAIAAAGHGELAIVDEINRRVDRYTPDGKRSTISLGGDTAQDVALGKDGVTAVLDRLADKNVQVFGADGKLKNEVSLEGKGVPEGGGVTGLFADDGGLYVERAHEAVVRVADGSGQSDPSRPELQGRPSRDGRLLLAALVGDHAQGQLFVRAADRQTGLERWQRALLLGTPILHLLALDSDRQGNVYVAVDVGREGPNPPYAITDEKIVIERLSGGGEPRGALELPALPSADESFRPITVDDDGNVYVMAATDSGLTVTRYSFP